MYQSGEEISQIGTAFTYHPPKEGQPERYEAIRVKGKELADLISKECPQGREKSLAFTKLQEAVMWANAAIACRESDRRMTEGQMQQAIDSTS